MRVAHEVVRRRRWALVLAFAMTAAACGTSGDDTTARSLPSTTTSTTAPVPRYDDAGALVGAHDCIVGDPSRVRVPLAHTEHGLFLFFKRGLHTSIVQHVEVARSVSGSLDGPWQLLGEPDLGLTENFQFLVIDGVWHVLATTIPIHVPALFRLVGDPANPSSWLHWQKVATFDVPQEAWNRGETAGIDHETANSAYLCDARRADGYWYLFYAGSEELTSFEGRGHAKIGIARSRDLRSWTVPPH